MNETLQHCEGCVVVKILVGIDTLKERVGSKRLDQVRLIVENLILDLIDSLAPTYYPFGAVLPSNACKVRQPKYPLNAIALELVFDGQVLLCTDYGGE